MPVIVLAMAHESDPGATPGDSETGRKPERAITIEGELEIRSADSEDVTIRAMCTTGCVTGMCPVSSSGP